MEQIQFIPGVHPSYKSQFDKLTVAYIANQVNPYDCCGCFVGNLLNRTSMWNRCKSDLIIYDMGSTVGRVVTPQEMEEARLSIEAQSNGFYTPEEIIDLEGNFMRIVRGYGDFKSWRHPTPKMEDVLFRAFEATLNGLKQLHLSKGEIIDETPVFVKRSLVTM